MWFFFSTSDGKICYYKCFGLDKFFIFILNLLVIFWVNCKLHPWSLGLTRFYTTTFQKLDFYTLKFGSVSNSPPPPPGLVFAINWHITMLKCFIFAKLTPKLCSFYDDQVKNRHNQNYVVSCLNLKHKPLA